MAVEIKQFCLRGGDCKKQVLKDVESWMKEVEKSKKLNIVSVAQSEINTTGNIQTFTLTVFYEKKSKWWPF